MVKTTVITSHTSTLRDSWWYLIQESDGTLWVEHEDDSDPKKGKTRVSINDALKQGIAAPQLQALVDRMFEKPDA